MLVAVTIGTTVASATAISATGPEGVWSFNGGEIAVQKTASGEFTGTVVRETRFAECAHPVGQEIWKRVTPQADGSFWGVHQWYVQQGGKCLTNENYVGPTAFRVLSNPEGKRYLMVCFSRPGGPQPTISATGASSEDTFGCSDSMLTAPLSSGALSFHSVVSGLPSARACLSKRRFMIHVRDPRNDAFKLVKVTIVGKRLKTRRHGSYVAATVDLRGLHKGTFTLHITGVTVQGRKLNGSRTFHTCTRGRRTPQSHSH
jgi:hypothetical protein